MRNSLKEIYLKEAARIAQERSQSSSILLTTRVSKPSCRVIESEATDLFKELTSREEEILLAIVRGKSNKLIAADFDISENTVRNHVAKILKKIKVNNRTEAAFLYFKKVTEKVNGDNEAKPEKTLLDKIIEQEKPKIGKVKLRKKLREAARAHPPEILHPLEVRYGFLSKSSLKET